MGTFATQMSCLVPKQYARISVYNLYVPTEVHSN